MKKCVKIAVIVAGAIIAAAVLSACGRNAAPAASGASAGGGARVLPVANNPIHNDATASGLVIVSTQVENNTDPLTNKPISDRLQIELKNTSNQTMGNFAIYYGMTDSKTGASEGYYQKLNGLSLAPGQTRTIFFDNAASPDHFPENKYSLYRTSPNEVRFTIELSTPGFKPATSQAVKAAGTGEQSD